MKSYNTVRRFKKKMKINMSMLKITLNRGRKIY